MQTSVSTGVHEKDFHLSKIAAGTHLLLQFPPTLTNRLFFIYTSFSPSHLFLPKQSYRPDNKITWWGSQFWQHDHNNPFYPSSVWRVWIAKLHWILPPFLCIFCVKRPAKVQLYNRLWIWDVWHCPLEWQSNQTFPLETGAKCCSRRGWLLIFSVSGDGASRLTRLGCLNKNFSANRNMEKTLRVESATQLFSPFLP